MRKLYSLLLFAFCATFVNAQYYYNQSTSPGNPGGLNTDPEFPVGGGLDPSWVTILGGGQATPAWSTTQTIPFAFNFNGVPVTEYKVSSSGVLTFNPAANPVPSSTNTTLPNAQIPDNSVVIWGLAGPGANDIIVNKTFGTAPNRQHWVFFTSYSIAGGSANCWTYWSIVLEESTNKIYLVDQRHANCGALNLTLGIQVNSSTAVMTSLSPAVTNISADNDPTDADNYYYEFIPGIRPDYDMAGSALNVPNFLAAVNAPFTVSGELVNFGAQTVTSFDINYQANTGAVVTQTISGVNIPTSSSYTFTHPTPWNPATGTYTLKAFASNINGNPDQNPNNDEISKQVQVVANLTQRRPLLEVFTSSTCGPCRPGNTNLDNIVGQNPGVANQIRYQQNFPGTGDPYCTPEAVARRNYYGVNSIPRLEIDGQWDQNAASLTTPILTSFADVPSFVEMSGTYLVNGQVVGIDIDVTPFTNISNAVLHIAIYEATTFNNVKTNGETEFHYVMKKMIPSNTGEMVTGLTANDKRNFNRVYEFNGNYRLSNNAGDPVNHASEHSVENFANLGVVAWLQNPATREIYQSVDLTPTSIGLNENAADFSVNVFPNPAADVLQVLVQAETNKQVGYTIVNQMGQKVASGAFEVAGNVKRAHDIDVNSLANGLYFLNINDGAGQRVVKFQVAK
ncbi:MAG: T9SS type A sorting domain-containing protein [Schleiferiaceae bacterium]|nr:T9SS type A sorting domain-containing protein [Schleiferiaceae bacterium]